MKAKLKNVELAKKKGFKHVKISLKKFLKEDFPQPALFFYDSAFDYEEDGTMPILYISDMYTSSWKKYIKENKMSKTFAAGQCKYEDGMLSLLVNTGKGGKTAILKIINKELLKPFARAQVTESIDTAEDDTLPTNNGGISDDSSSSDPSSVDQMTDDIGSTSIDLQELGDNILKGFSPIQKQFDRHQVEQVVEDLKTWMITFNESEVSIKQSFKSMGTNMQKVAAYAKKSIQVDNAISKIIGPLFKDINKYNNLVDHTTDEGISLKSNIESAFEQALTMASKIKNIELVDVLNDYLAELKN